ncbi:MAG: hypothetical protein PHN49_02555 [Candidatus Omnitrophica bacterium]|nr:hypothetical protein [Candidatus Omnitrophota bacterium]MDD5670500.1 hypothetical protein [Candidatus Omnitrophota bacterium]
MKWFFTIFIIFLGVSSLSLSKALAIDEPAKVSVQVSSDIATVRAPSNAVPVNTVVDLTKKLFNQGVTDTLLSVDESASEFDKKAKSLQVNEVEVMVGVNANGNFFIASGGAEGSLKYVLKKK